MPSTAPFNQRCRAARPDPIAVCACLHPYEPQLSELMVWIRNTSRHPDDEVRELVRFATRGIDMNRVCVNVKGGRGLSARAYDGVPSISNAPRRARYLVTIKVGNGVRFPVGPHNRNGKAPDEVGPRNRFPFFTYADWREWLVAAAAHEARHIHQYRHGERRSELDCERFADDALTRYRSLARHR